MHELSLTDIKAYFASGELTSVQLTERYLERIEQVDRAGPTLRAIIEVNPDVLAIAAERDGERRAGHVRGPLHGVPITIKDNIDTHDRTQTTAGSLALAGSIAPRDAFIVERLRAAGAVILGKTNMSEWANFRSTRSVSGWSSRGGLTRNPYALDRTACGSSSGAGAAVAANLCAVGVGTETDGSIIYPSSMNGLVGIKPTVGLVSRSGIIPISHSQDTAGPMARSVDDAAILLGVLTGVDPRDAATRPSAAHAHQDYTQFLNSAALRGARIGVARTLAGNEPRLLAIFERCIDVLRNNGATIVDPVELPQAPEYGPNELIVLEHEFKAGLNKYLTGLGKHAPVRSLADVINFNTANAAQVMPLFGQELLESSNARNGLRSQAYRTAHTANRRLTRQQGIDAVLQKHRLNAFIVPSGPPAWTIDLVNGDAHTGEVQSTSLAAIAGYPHITVPAGHICGLPIGLSFIASAWQESTLIRLAYAFEQATRARIPPQYRAHADVSVIM